MPADRISRAQIERRVATREALLGEIRKWLQEHGEKLDAEENRAYLRQWEKAQERDGFTMLAPGRWKSFRHLIDFPPTYGEIMPSKATESLLRARAGGAVPGL